ncbi:M50 family metallopeptidase [Candidatus Dojkabacteria bacterium]|nr:M50 family metallopeptidase [Candidatus Dojkabacteria bacterium]
MDIYKKISEKTRSQEIKIKVDSNVKSVQNESESKKKGRKKYPLIIIKDDQKCLLLEEKEAFIWRQIEAGLSLKEINVWYFQEYDSVGTEYIRYLINEWCELGLLDVDMSMYRKINRNIVKPQNIFQKISRIINYRIDIGIARRLVFWIYRVVSFIISQYTTVFLVLISIAGLVVAFLFAGNKAYWINNDVGSIGNALTTIVLCFFSIFFHELGHALASMKYGLKPSSVGFSLFLGYPIFYVNTTNAWSLPKKQRLVIDISGVLMDIIIAGIFGWLRFFTKSDLLAQISNLFIFINLVSIGINLIPFIEFDGYYILMDLIGETNLKEKGMLSIMQLLKGEGKRRTKSLAFVLFGLMSIISTVTLILVSINFWLNGLQKIF